MLSCLMSVLLLAHSAHAQCQLADPALVFIGFRHGARAVATPLDGDSNNDKWPVAFGQLTQQGMQEHYENGEKVRAMYKPLFDTYDATKILMRSSAMDRTLMSAASFSASLFKPDDDQQFQAGFPWQPTAIYTSAVLTANHVDLQEMNTEAAKAVANITQVDNEMVTILETATNISATDSPSQFFELLDNLVTEKFANFSLPYGLDDSYTPRIQVLKDCMFIQIFGDRPTSCLLAPQILHDLVNKTDTFLSQNTAQNAYVYSMHDANVFAIVSILSSYDTESPPFAATVFFEIRPNSDCNGYVIKLLYRPFLDRDPQELEINDCGTPCPYDVFKNVTRNIEQTCNYNAEDGPSCYI